MLASPNSRVLCMHLSSDPCYRKLYGFRTLTDKIWKLSGFPSPVLHWLGLGEPLKG